MDYQGYLDRSDQKEMPGHQAKGLTRVTKDSQDCLDFQVSLDLKVIVVMMDCLDYRVLKEIQDYLVLMDHLVSMDYPGYPVINSNNYFVFYL